MKALVLLVLPLGPSRLLNPVLLQIYHQYVKLRKDFGRPTSFVDEAAEVPIQTHSTAALQSNSPYWQLRH